MAVDKKGNEMQEYPKLVKTPSGKARVFNKEEEAKVLGVEEAKEVKKPKDWGK